MFGLGLPELLIIAVVVLVIFGAGKIPQVMGDLGKGLRGLKEGVQFNPDDEEVKKIGEE